MRIYENIEAERERVQNCIDKFGYTPDHNLDWFLYCADEGDPRAIVWDDGYMIFGYENKKVNSFILLADPVAPQDQYEKILAEVIEYILPRYDKITVFDVRDHTHNIIKGLYPGNYEFYYDIVWPVIEMSSFDPKLPGGRFKDIRNALNKFYREHRVEIIPAESIKAEDLHGVVDRWFTDRVKAGIEELFPNRYHNMIKGKFGGIKSARAMFVDGQIAGFNAGWETPNHPEEWAAAIGIHDFSVKDLGIALLMEDLEWIKNAGYKICDLEGSEPEPLRFKTQFLSEYTTYKTSTFWLKK